ncbi:uncharacterized protein ACIBXB_018838 [Morphnus guianensis]
MFSISPSRGHQWTIALAHACVPTHGIPALRRGGGRGGGCGSGRRAGAERIGGQQTATSRSRGGSNPKLDKAPRTPSGRGFSEEEKFLILDEFSLRKDILIPKSGQYKNTPDWQRAWEEIAAATNPLSPLVQRTPDEIRKKRHNMVIDARRELALEKHPLLRRRPQEKLLHIFTFFNKPGLGLPDLPLSASAFRAASGPPGMLKVTLGLLLHGQSSAAALRCGLLWPTGTPLAPRLHFPGGVEWLRAPGCLGHGNVGPMSEQR